MIKNEFNYQSADGKTQIHAIEWKPEKEIIGVIQIAHGVTEHQTTRTDREPCVQ